MIAWNTFDLKAPLEKASSVKIWDTNVHLDRFNEAKSG